jgi:hypothetical protein
MVLHRLFPLRPSVKVFYYTFLWQEGTCPLWSGWCLDLLARPTLKNLPYFIGTWRKQTAGHLTTGCRAIQLQMWHPWFVFKTSRFLRAALAWDPSFIPLCVPNKIRYPVWGQEPCCLMLTHHRLLTEEWIVIQSGLLLWIWNRWSCSEKPYVSVLYGWTFYILVLFLYIRPVQIITPSGVCQRGISVAAYVLGKAWHQHCGQ